jgi:hypothetical protein
LSQPALELKLQLVKQSFELTCISARFMELHFVKISFEPVAKEEVDVLLREDERLNDLFTDRAVVEYDGFERGRQDFVMYFYGGDADRMTSAIVPELRNLQLVIERSC